MHHTCKVIVVASCNYSDGLTKAKRGYSKWRGYSEGSKLLELNNSIISSNIELRSLSSFRNNYLNNTELPTVL